MFTSLAPQPDMCPTCTRIWKTFSSKWCTTPLILQGVWSGMLITAPKCGQHTWGQRWSGGMWLWAHTEVRDALEVLGEKRRRDSCHTHAHMWTSPVKAMSIQCNITRTAANQKSVSHIHIWKEVSYIWTACLLFLQPFRGALTRPVRVCSRTRSVFWQSPEIISVIMAYLYSKSNIYVRLHLLNKVWQLRGCFLSLCEFCFHFVSFPLLSFHFSFSFILPKTSSILHYYWLQIGPVSGFSFSPISISQLLLWTHPLLGLPKHYLSPKKAPT